MIAQISYSGKPCKNIRLQIAPDSGFEDILRVLKEVEFHNSDMDTEQIHFAVLELINNSIRAHKEKQRNANITLDYYHAENYLRILLRDWGGGFDISKLPYDINDDLNQIDLKGEQFIKYREKNNFKRFGMGIFIAKKTFSSFYIKFRSVDGDIVDWDSGKAAGTCIDMILE